MSRMPKKLDKAFEKLNLPAQISFLHAKSNDEFINIYCITSRAEMC